MLNDIQHIFYTLSQAQKTFGQLCPKWFIEYIGLREERGELSIHFYAYSEDDNPHALGFRLDQRGLYTTNATKKSKEECKHIYQAVEQAFDAVIQN